MNTDTGSTRILRPKSRLPAVSQRQAVDGCERSDGLSPSMTAKETSAATKAPATAAVARKPAARLDIAVPRSVISAAAPSGRKRQTQAAAIMVSSAERPELVHVELEVAARHGDDQAEADDHLGGRHGHHGEREDLPGAAAVRTREADQGEVGPVEHDLEREEDDQRAAAEEHAERAGREQEGGNREVPGDVRPLHSPPRRSGVSGSRG